MPVDESRSDRFRLVAGIRDRGSNGCKVRLTRRSHPERRSGCEASHRVTSEMCMSRIPPVRRSRHPRASSELV